MKKYILLQRRWQMAFSTNCIHTKNIMALNTNFVINNSDWEKS